MIQATEKILDFHVMRVKAHVIAVNYFAKLIGKNYPNHDADKFAPPLMEPFAIGSAIDYLSQSISDEDNKIRRGLCRQHYANNSHHASHFKEISDMRNEDIDEMVCDWFATTLENNLLLNFDQYKDVKDFYIKTGLPESKFTNEQQEWILSLISRMEHAYNKEDFLSIWKPVKDFAGEYSKNQTTGHLLAKLQGRT